MPAFSESNILALLDNLEQSIVANDKAYRLLHDRADMYQNRIESLAVQNDVLYSLVRKLLDGARADPILGCRQVFETDCIALEEAINLPNFEQSVLLQHDVALLNAVADWFVSYETSPRTEWVRHHLMRYASSLGAKT